MVCVLVQLVESSRGVIQFCLQLQVVTSQQLQEYGCPRYLRTCIRGCRTGFSGDFTYVNNPGLVRFQESLLDSQGFVAGRIGLGRCTDPMLDHQPDPVGKGDPRMPQRLVQVAEFQVRVGVY